MKKIGIIGGGIMAAGMIENYLKNGYDVHVWNRTKAHVDGLLQSGAIWCDTPKTVAEAADIIIECVSDDAASQDVWMNDNTGILSGANADKVLIVSSSLSLQWVDQLSKVCHEKALQLLDIPITGSRVGAEAGTLRLLVGGEASVLDSAREELEVISEKIFYFGESGSGMRFKLMLNSLIGIQTNAAVQAILLAKKSGVDPVAFREAIVDGAMGVMSTTTVNALRYVEAPSETLNFATKWLEKDLRYACDMAAQYETKFDLLDVTQKDFATALEHFADEDITHIAKIYE